MIIVDIDGVITNNSGIEDFETWERKFPTMLPNKEVITLLDPLVETLVFVTGRSEKYKLDTLDWFRRFWPRAITKSHGFWFREKDEGHLDSSVVKSRILDDLVELGLPTPILAIDDIENNITMFKSRGITTLRCLSANAIPKKGDGFDVPS